MCLLTVNFPFKNIPLDFDPGKQHNLKRIKVCLRLLYK